PEDPDREHPRRPTHPPPCQPYHPHPTHHRRRLRRPRHLPLHLLRMARQKTRTPLHQTPQRRHPHQPRRIRTLAHHPGRGRLMTTTYDVRIHKTEVWTGKKTTTYYVRWKVASRPWKEPFKTSALADSFRSDLISASRRGEAFDVVTGRPIS